MNTNNQKRKKNELEGFDNALGDSDGMRIGYHSEKGSTKDDTSDGMRIGYHSEKGSTKDDTSDGMRIGYHSEKANPSKHSKRLHQKHSGE